MITNIALFVEVRAEQLKEGNHGKSQYMRMIPSLVELAKGLEY
jgi:hypothetical protein